MIGVFALLGEQIYFNETLQKTNLQPCEFPLENWVCDKGLFIPLSSHAVAAMDVMISKEGGTFSDWDVPPLCGILISHDMKLYEVGVLNSQLSVRRVPTGKGAMYVRAYHRDIEEAYYAALRITKDLPQATALAYKATVSLPGRPVYTTLPIAAWAGFKKDAALIRSLTQAKLKKQLRSFVQQEIEKRK